MKKSKLEASCSSPIATVEEIQKRLLRPQDSQSFSPFNSSQNHQCNAKNQNSYENRKIRETESRIEAANKRLEDYLDPELLRTVRAKVGSQKRNIGGEVKSTRRTSIEFDEFDRKSGYYNELKKAEIEKKGAIDLRSDSNSIESIFSEFSQFEGTKLKRFTE